MAQAITYQSGPRRSDLRTVVVEGAHPVVLVSGTELLMGKLLHGTTCAHSFWDEQLGTSGDDFGVERSKVRQVREMQIAVRATHK